MGANTVSNPRGSYDELGDSSDENYVSSTGASGTDNGGSSRQSSDWALRDNKDIKAEEVRPVEVAKCV